MMERPFFPSRHHYLLWSIVVTFASSFFVEVEPAPYDVLLPLLLLLAMCIWQPKLRRPIGAGALYIAVFLSVQAVSVLSSDDVGNSLRFFAITTYLAVTSLLLAVLVSDRGKPLVDAIFAGLYIGSLVTGVAVILTIAGVLPLEDVVMAYGGTRVEGFFKDPNVMAPAMIPVALFAFLQMANRFSWFHLGVFLNACAMIILGFSRGAFVTFALALGILVMFLVKQRGARLARRVIACLFVAAAGLSIAFVVVRNSDYSSLLEAGGRSTEYDQDRFFVHEVLVEEALARPIGHGPGQANAYIQGNFNLEGSNAAHNTYLRLAFENGWLGLMSYLALIFATVWVAMHASRKKGGELAGYLALLLACFVATLVSALAVDTLHWRHAWWLPGLIWGVAAYRTRCAKGAPQSAAVA